VLVYLAQLLGIKSLALNLAIVAAIILGGQWIWERREERTRNATNNVHIITFGPRNSPASFVSPTLVVAAAYVVVALPRVTPNNVKVTNEVAHSMYVVS
jgi:hypothetical protein